MYSCRVCLQCGRTYPWQLGTNLGQGKRPFSSFVITASSLRDPPPSLPQPNRPPSFPAQVPREHARVSTTHMLSLIQYRIFLDKFNIFFMKWWETPMRGSETYFCRLFWRISLLQTNLRVHLADHYPCWQASESRNQKGQNGKGRRHEMRHGK